jgi:hypothetical protein
MAYMADYAALIRHTHSDKVSEHGSEPGGRREKWFRFGSVALEEPMWVRCRFVVLRQQEIGLPGQQELCLIERGKLGCRRQC